MVKNKHKTNKKDANKENNNAATDLIDIELITCEGLSVKL